MNVTDPPPSSDEWTCEGQADILELLPRPKALDLGLVVAAAVAAWALFAVCLVVVAVGSVVDAVTGGVTP